MKMIYKIVDTETKLDFFDCGIGSINQMVKECVYPVLCNQAKIISVSAEDEVVAFYSLAITSVEYADSDAEAFEYCHQTSRFGALKVNFIAVDKNVQHIGIGKQIMKKIIMEAIELHAIAPVRFVVLDALYDKVEWYRDIGFDYVKSSDTDETLETVRMFFDLMTDEEWDRLKNYNERYYI